MLISRKIYTIVILVIISQFIFSNRQVAAEQAGLESSDKNESTGFTFSLTVSDNLPNSKDLIVGTDSTATAGFDAETDRLAPPQPPSGSFDARLRVNGQDFFTFYQPLTVEKTQWNILFAAETGYGPVTLSWDSADLPSEGRMLLTDTIDGSFVNVDMSEQSSLTVEQAFITQLTLTHQLTVDVVETYRANWDLVGLPVDVEYDSYADLFPTSNANTLYGYNGTYNESQILVAGAGYWLNFAEQDEVTMTGFPIRELDLELRANWNLIAGLSESTQIVDEGEILLPGSLYGYNGTYNESTTLEPGNGYWVATQAAGSVTLLPAESTEGMSGGLANEDLIRHPRHDEAMMSQAMVIEFDQGGASLLSLVAGATIDEQYHPLQLSLPPAPPQGSVDVRFDNNRWITEDFSPRIHIQQNGEPLYMVVKSSQANVSDNNLSTGVEVTYMDGDRELGSIRANYGQRMEVPAQASELMMVPDGELVDQDIPMEFSLGQNYPNPFNPSTNIEYALPEAVDVRLEIFNMLGQRVAVLVDAQQQAAGRYTMNFDASNLTSGVYIYRLTAGSFTQTQKMMLVK